MVSRGRTEQACVLNRWVQGPDAAAPGVGGADSEIGRGSRWRRGGGGMRAAMPWRQRRRADAVGGKTPGVCSGPGSSVKPDGSEEDKTDKVQSGVLLLSRKPEKDKGDKDWPTEAQTVRVTAKQSYHESDLD